VSARARIHRAVSCVLQLSAACFGAAGYAAVPDYRDTLDLAVSAPETLETLVVDRFDPFVADTVNYDSNLFRLPSQVTDLAALTGLGPNSTRADYVNSASAGLGAQWVAGSRQSIDLDVRVDDNRFRHNTDLSNVSTDDKLAWNWGVGGALSGQVGADYKKYLASFVNSLVYSRNLIDKTEYFAAGRYQVDSRWAVFAGVLDTKYGLSAAQSKVNNSTNKAVDFGAEYMTGAANTLGFDYRYTDARYPNNIELDGALFQPDYREERAQGRIKYALSDKTLLEGTAGYLRRQYASGAIGSFGGGVWRGILQWQPTFKTQLVFNVWRQLAADLTAATDYFVSTGASISPVYIVSEKLTLSLIVSDDDRKYLGSNPGAIISGPQRHDKVVGEQAALNYTPTRALTVNVTYGHERRDCNLPIFQYKDDLASIGATFKF
jgi:exopolysaccharide biosynthesis operon protein EpsL